jgi:hypothetical protein
MVLQDFWAGKDKQAYSPSVVLHHRADLYGLPERARDNNGALTLVENNRPPPEPLKEFLAFAGDLSKDHSAIPNLDPEASPMAPLVSDEVAEGR